jgi:hypothetical protein
MSDFNESLEQLRKKQLITLRHTQELQKIAIAFSKLMREQRRYSVASQLQIQRSILAPCRAGKELKTGTRALSIVQIKDEYSEIKKQIAELEIDIALNRN